MVRLSRIQCFSGVVLALGCNSVLGIEERDWVPAAGTAGTDPASAAGKQNGGTSNGGASSGTTSDAGSPPSTPGASGTTNSETAGSDSGGASNAGGTRLDGGSSAILGGAGGDGADDPQLELDDAVKDLDGFHFENDCGYVPGHDLSSCESGEMCWDSAEQQHLVRHVDIPIGGVSGHQYDIKLRLRGVLEPRDYPAGCARVTNPGGSDIAVVEGCDGFENSSTVTYNIYELLLPSPARRYYLNGVPTHPPHVTNTVDLEWTIRVGGQTTLGFTFDDLNGGQNRHCGAGIPGVMSAAAGGQFFQLDVEQTTLVE